METFSLQIAFIYCLTNSNGLADKILTPQNNEIKIFEGYDN